MKTDLVPAAVVAAEFGVDPGTVAQWARDERIPTAVITAGGHRRYRLADVRAALAEQAAS